MYFYIQIQNSISFINHIQSILTNRTCIILVSSQQDLAFRVRAKNFESGIEDFACTTREQTAILYYYELRKLLQLYIVYTDLCTRLQLYMVYTRYRQNRYSSSHTNSQNRIPALFFVRPTTSTRDNMRESRAI